MVADAMLGVLADYPMARARAEHATADWRYTVTEVVISGRNADGQTVPEPAQPKDFV